MATINHCCNAEFVASFMCRLNGVIRHNNFFLINGTPEALELYLLEKEDFLLWCSDQLEKTKVLSRDFQDV